MLYGNRQGQGKGVRKRKVAPPEAAAGKKNKGHQAAVRDLAGEWSAVHHELFEEGVNLFIDYKARWRPLLEVLGVVGWASAVTSVTLDIEET